MDIIGVVGQPGNDGGYGEAVHLRLGKKHRPPVKVPAKPPGHIHGHPGRHAVGRDVAEGRAEGHDQHPSSRLEDSGQVPRGNAVVDNVGQQKGEQQFQHGGGEFHRHAHRHPWKMGPEIAENGLHAGPPFMRK